MRSKLKRIDRTLLELLTGILIFAVLCQLIGLPFSIHLGKYAIGLWVGTALAVFSAIHMFRSLCKAFECDENTAKRLVAGGYVIRYLVTLVVIGALFYTDTGYVLSGLLGYLGLKAAAYMQPFIHKFYNWLFHETDPIPEPLIEDEKEDPKDEESKEVRA